MATSKGSNANTGHSFLLNDEELETLSGKRGRKPTDSEYLEDVRNALKTPGEVYGIRLSDTVKAPWVSAQVRKAFKQLEIESSDFTVYNREEKGFVAYIYSPKLDEDAAEDAAEESAE